MKTPKEEEIILLNKLHGLNGYFADEFSQSDLDTMTFNIKSDFTLLVGTRISEELVLKESTIKELEASVETVNTVAWDALREICELRSELDKKTRLLSYILTAILDGDPLSAEDYFPADEIIEKKIKLGLPLSESEGKYVISRLK